MPIYVADGIKDEMQMGILGIFMKGVDNLIFIRKEATNLHGNADYDSLRGNLMGHEGYDKMVRSDTGILIV